MPSTVRQRPDSDEIAHGVKRHKKEHNYSDDFADGLLDDANAKRLNHEYCETKPFLHAVVNQLFQDDLLTNVKDECLRELSFSEKQTDIYRVFQTGDLASLSYLSKDQLSLLPNLLRLRDALYSQEFRAFIRKVTSCGPLSGKLQDMSVNSYKQGCHLLNHDDVIGSRRVSYILYMPLPKDKTWKPEWGGALELYPVKLDANGVEEPEPTPNKIIPPSWNQFVFFEIQPGHSFHSVEEVVVNEDDCQKQRLSISGWFHKSQEDEDGYEDEKVAKVKSSLEQLTSTSNTYVSYPDDPQDSSETIAMLSEEHISFLSAFIDPIYLRPDVLAQICENFVDESTLDLKNFLCEPLAARLDVAIRERDKSDNLDGTSRSGKIPAHKAGAEGENAWSIRGPPHKFRYCTLPQAIQKPKSDTDALTILSSPKSSVNEVLGVLQNTLLPSLAFRAWLKLAAKVITTSHFVQARRFRPGLDYTLAMSDDEQSILDVVLHLTPEIEDTVSEANGKGKGKARDDESDDEDEEGSGWAKGEWGGWECYMAPHEGEEDPAVYRSGSKKRNSSARSEVVNVGEQNGGAQSSFAHESGEDAMSEDQDEDEDDDGTLLTVQPEFNRLSLVLREKTVLRFVKYVSASAPGSRWDVSGEYTVSVPDEEDEEDEEEWGGIEADGDEGATSDDQ